MTHLFKIPLENSDMIVKNIDFNNNKISYHIRDKQSGQRLEPDKLSDFEIGDDRIHFDNIRYIGLQFAQGISQLLNG